MTGRNTEDKKTHIIHPFEPIINPESRVLILGSLPSVKSRAEGFYYGHPQNRFWKVISSIFGEECPKSIDEKRELVLRKKIALFDSITECDIVGSSDASIENAVATDIEKLILGTSVGIIYCNGSTSYKYCLKYNKKLSVPVVCLPSTSPANAAWSENALICTWGRVSRYLNRTDIHINVNTINNNINNSNNNNNVPSVNTNVASKYYSLNSYIKDTYGMKLYKTPVDGGFTCPNRDGSKGVGGCIFCDNEGSGHFTGRVRREANDVDNSVLAQINRGKELIASKMPDKGEYGYIAYFQAYTSTYAPVERLRQLYEEAIEDSEVKILSIATRPDCLGKDVLALLKEMSEKIIVWVELGLQTSKADSSVQINRCYDNKVYEKAISDLHRSGVSHVITHIILGLPGENKSDMLESVRFACNSGTDGLKLQLLHVLKGTVLADMYYRGEFETLSLEEYTDIVKEAIRIIPPDVVIHRITGDGDKNKLIAPLWSGDKKRVLNYMNSQLKQ